MIFFVNGKKERLNPYHMKFSPCIGETINSKVYLVKGKAYKLYQPYTQEKMTKEKVDILRRIKTKRIILPESAILNKRRECCGTVAPYIENLGKENLLEFSKEKLLEELLLLHKDALLLSDYCVSVNDLSFDNTSFHDGIYPIDFGRFNTKEETQLDENLTFSYNFDQVNEFFYNQILCKLIKEEYTMQKANLVRKEILSFLAKGNSVWDYIEKQMHQESLREYIKRKGKSSWI